MELKRQHKQTVRQPYGRYHSRQLGVFSRNMTTVVATVGLSDRLLLMAFHFYLPRPVPTAIAPPQSSLSVQEPKSWHNPTSAAKAVKSPKIQLATRLEKFLKPEAREQNLYLVPL